MSFFALTNLAIPVRDGGVRALHEEIPDAPERTQRGNDARSFRTIKRSWEVQTIPLSNIDSEMYLRWIMGRHMWRIGFDRGYAAENGLQPEGGYTGRFTDLCPLISTANNILGKHWQSNTSTNSFSYNFPVTTSRNTDWSMMTWHNVGCIWAHYAISTKGGVSTKYKNNAPTGVTIGFVGHSVVRDDVAKLLFSAENENGIANSNVGYDEMVIFGWPVNSAMVSAIYEFGTSSVFLPDFPKHILTGDSVQKTALNSYPQIMVRCVDVQSNLVQGRKSGDTAWQNAMKVISFKAVEV
jgi:hypothetical protein